MRKRDVKKGETYAMSSGHLKSIQLSTDLGQRRALRFMACVEVIDLNCVYQEKVRYRSVELTPRKGIRVRVLIPYTGQCIEPGADLIIRNVSSLIMPWREFQIRTKDIRVTIEEEKIEEKEERERLEWLVYEAAKSGVIVTCDYDTEDPSFEISHSEVVKLIKRLTLLEKI